MPVPTAGQVRLGVWVAQGQLCDHQQRGVQRLRAEKLGRAPFVCAGIHGS